MKRLIKMLMLAALAVGLAPGAKGFSLLGQFKNWQITPWGYMLPGDIGGPMTLNEGFRWNVPVIYYAFDASFVTYFGRDGMAAVDQAMKIFNDLPKFSEITNDDSSLYIKGEPVPTDSRGPQNFGLNIAGVRDLKSQALELVIEELGLAEPTRWTWAIRGRNEQTIGGVVFTNFSIIKLNYDPITYQTTFARVNGALYSYEIFDPAGDNPYFADAIERAIDTTNPYGPAVADQSIAPGEYYFGLTHDDVGGLRFLYNKNNLAVEDLLPAVIGGRRLTGGSPWAPYIGITNFVNSGTNNLVLNTNTIVRTGLRPGLNKLTFKRANYDSLLGQNFRPATNFYNDFVISNAQRVLQPVQRITLQPDILFTAEDLGLLRTLTPVLTMRSGTGGWQNNDVLNGNDGTTGDAFGGPGVIAGQVVISFSDQLPYVSNTSPDFLLDETLFNSAVWGSFDENSEAPIIYPAYLNLTLEDIQRLIRQPAP